MNVLKLYLQDLAQDLAGLSSPVPREEEVALSNLIQRGKDAARQLVDRDEELIPLERCILQERVREGLEARNRLVEATLPLVIHIAKGYVGHGVEMADLIQAGNEGLIVAASKFNPERGRFSTYAYWWVRQRIVRAITGQSHKFHLPETMQYKICDFLKAGAELQKQLGYIPTPEEIAEEVDISPYRLQEIVEALQRTISLEQELDREDEPDTPDKIIPDKDAPSPFQLAAEREMQKAVREAVDTLPEELAEVIKLYFGLEGEGMSLRELAGELGCSHTHVSQLLQEGLQCLRHPSRSRKLKELV